MASSATGASHHPSRPCMETSKEKENTPHSWVGCRRPPMVPTPHHRLSGTTVVARQLAVLGVPSGAGVCGVGQEQTPAAIRRAGLIELLGAVGFEVTDLGDSPVVPWRPDRARPRVQNLEEVVEMVRRTSSRVADALDEHDRTVLALGGDCTVGIGTIAGARSGLGDLAVVYFDLHSDLNTPTSARDGALDWMALAHMLAIEGSEPTLVAATGPVPLLRANQVVLFAHSESDA